jgi:anti-sigma-K factor RskA
MSDARAIPEELHVLAGEYVLGALDMAEMRAVRRRAMVDPALAAAIAGWERRMAPMAAAVPPAAPPPALWARIEQSVAPLADEMDVAPAPPRALAQESPRPARSTEPPLVPRRRGMVVRQRRVWPWQFATLGSLALAAGIAALVLVPSLSQRLDLHPGLLAQPRIAALTPPDSHTPGFLAEARPDGSVVLTALQTVPVPQGHDLELWILPPGAKAPASLGVLPAAGRRVAVAHMPPPGTQLMVSVEPVGGSPTGAPTGPVVYAGSLAQLSY